MPNASLRRARLAGLLAALALPIANPAQAHPHVWIVARAVVEYDGARVTGVRHNWRFDPAYGSFVTQGLDANGDGRLSPEELQGLATENAANLAEFGYFTKLKVGGVEPPFAAPREPRMAMDADGLTLSFLLPLKTPAAQGRGVTALEVYDPTYLVAFSLADGADAVTLRGAPAGCAVSITRPKATEPKTADAGKPMTEAFFDALTAASAGYGVQFANRALVACP